MDNGGWPRDLPPLVRAAFLGQLARVRELLAEGVSPDQTDEYGCSAIGRACGGGHWEIARVLIRAGAVVDSPEADRWRPIHGAAAGGDLDLVKQLAGVGVDVSGALDQAAIEGQVHVVRWLVEEASADVDESVDGDGLTPLLNAAEAGQTEVVRELIRLGADCRQTYEGESAADIAAGMGFEDLAAELRGEKLEPPRLAWMKWFNENSSDAWKIEDSSAFGAQLRAIEKSYNAHMNRLLPTLPRDLRCLPEAGGRLKLHDADVLLLHSDPAQRRVIVDLEPYQPSTHELLRLRIIYTGAEIVAPSREELRRYKTDRPTVDNGELDFADGGRFEHRIQLWEPLDPTIVIRFADATVRLARFLDDGIELAPATEFYEAET